MKYEGSLINRLLENHDYTNGKFKVGTIVTEYLWSDSHTYTITSVTDEKHFTMFPNGAKSESPNDLGYSIVKRGNRWYQESSISKKKLEQIAKKRFEKDGLCNTYENTYNFLLAMWHLTDSQMKRFEQGKEVKTYKKIDIAIGLDDPYFDPEF